MTWLQEYKVYCLVFVLALGSWWLTQWRYESAQLTKLVDNNLDLISLEYSKMSTDETGLPVSELFAPEMQHSHKDGSSQFSQPIMTLFKPGQAPWVIRAETAVLEEDGDTLHMHGRSVINRDASPKNKSLTVVSADLLVKLSTHFAESGAYTELISPPHRTTGTGVEVTFDSPIHLKLLSTVKGYYELKKNPTH